jgi:hypothetical protein
MSLKSVLFGWLRAACVVGGAICLIVGLINLLSYLDKNNPDSLAIVFLCTGILAGAVLLYWLTVHFSRASYHRAVALASELGMSEQAVAELYAERSEAHGSQQTSDSELDDRWKQ